MSAIRKTITRPLLISLFVLTLALSCLVPHPNPAAASTPGTTTQRGSTSTLEAIDAIDAYIDAQMQELRIPGLALGIVQGNHVVHLKGYGISDPSGQSVTPQTHFAINSISKSFVALAIMQLVGQGKIELDAPVQRYLPWFQLADTHAAAQITIQQLLNQTSGLPESASYEDLSKPIADAGTLEERVRRLSATQLASPVGSSFEYTDANYDVLGLIVQTVASQPYSEYVQQQILMPLAMQQSSTIQPAVLPAKLATGYRSWFGFPIPYEQWYSHATLPSGDLISNADDMTHYLIAQMNEGRYNGSTLLSPQSVAAMHQPAVREEPDSEKFYGMGWEVRPMNGLTVVRHDGTSANYYADVVLDPTGNWGIVILLNVNSLNLYGGRLHALTSGILRLLHDQTPPVLPFMHHPLLFPAMIAILIITALILVWFVHMAFTWRRWHLWWARPHPRWRRWAALGLPLALTIGWALLLLVLVPQMTYPLPALQINVPDFGYTLWASSFIGLSFGVIRSLLSYSALRTMSASNAPRVGMMPAQTQPAKSA